MSSGLLASVVVVAGLACPVHMWWMHRRGKQVACCPPKREEIASDLTALRDRRAGIEAKLAEFDVAREVSPTRGG